MTNTITNELDNHTIWPNERLQTRYLLLEAIEAGWSELSDPTDPIVRLVFPEGYDPENRSSDRSSDIKAEADRRGVELSQ